MQIASAKDKNQIFGELCFYGIITEIWDLDYTKFGCDTLKPGVPVDHSQPVETCMSHIMRPIHE